MRPQAKRKRFSEPQYALSHRFFRGEFAVALPAVQEMRAHRLPGFFRQTGRNRLKYRLVLFLDLAQIFAKAVRVAFKRANALPRNDQTPEEIEKLHEAIVPCRQRNRLMEREFFFNRPPAL